MQVVLLHAVLQDFCSQNTKGLADVKKGLHIIPTYDKKKNIALQEKREQLNTPLRWNIDLQGMLFV